MTRIRPDGGVTGSINNPTTLSASGMWNLKDHERSTRGSIWPTAYVSPGESDPYFEFHHLLLHGDNTNGSNGANNNVFVDSSTNAYTITVDKGHPTQGTFSPFSSVGWSNYFNGTSDYLTIPYNSVFDWASAPTTIEVWIYPTAFANYKPIVAKCATGTGNNDWELLINSTGNIIFRYWTGSARTITTTSTVSLNTWSHIAVVYDSTNITVYINGVSGGSAAYVATLTTSSVTLVIGAAANGLEGASLNYFSGYISNLRYVKGGSAFYTSNFTVPTSALTAITNTQLLTCQDNRFKDGSTNAFTLTPAGTPAARPFSPFVPTAAYSNTNGGSVYFGGADSLLLPNSMTALSSGVYTLEAWFYAPSVTAGEYPLVKLYNAASIVELRIASSKIQGRVNNGGTIVGGNSTIYPNQWYHVALVKQSAGSGTATLYVNGVAESTTQTDTFNYTAFEIPRIGANQTPNIYYVGWLSSVRLLNVAQYSGTFTPPTSPFTNISGTIFLTNFTNAGIIDHTQKNSLNTFGAAALSNTQSKFGGSSIVFNGSTSYLTYPYQAGLTELQADFTIEAWVYITSFAAQSTLITIGSETTNRLVVAVNTSSQLLVDIYGTTNTLTGSTISLNTWTHVAVVRSGSTITGYLNGTSVGTASSSAVLGNSTGGVTVGRGNSSQYFSGYIDELLVTKYARYTSGFTPPTTAFLNQ